MSVFCTKVQVNQTMKAQVSACVGSQLYGNTKRLAYAMHLLCTDIDVHPKNIGHGLGNKAFFDLCVNH